MTNRLPDRAFALLPLGTPLSGMPLVNLGAASLTFGRAVCLMVLTLLFVNACYKGRLYKPNLSQARVLILLLLYGVLLAASGFWSNDISRALEYTTFYFWFSLLISALVLGGVSREGLIRSMDIWIFAALVVGAMCYVEIFYDVRFPGSRYYSDPGGPIFRPTANFHNENDLAVFLGLSSVILAARTLGGGSGTRVAAGLVALWFLYVILLTTSRGALLLFFAGIAFVYLPALKNRMSVAYIGMLALIVSATLALFYGEFSDRFEEVMLRFDAVSINEDARVLLLQNSMHAAQENFWMGVGGGNIEAYMGRFSNVRVVNVHNWLGEVLANTGILGAIIWAGIGFLLLGVYRVWKVSKSKSAHLSALVALLFTLPLWQSVVSSMIQFLPFWIIIAYLVVALDRRDFSEHECHLVKRARAVDL